MAPRTKSPLAQLEQVGANIIELEDELDELKGQRNTLMASLAEQGYSDKEIAETAQMSVVATGGIIRKLIAPGTRKRGRKPGQTVSTNGSDPVAAEPETPKRRGRPKAVAVEETPAKRRPGRPRKNPVEDEAAPVVAVPKRRGRPPKAAAAATAPTPEVAEAVAPRKRGRPRKAAVEAATPVIRRKRGRPRRATA